jgi:hypothetical protein
MSKVFEKPLKIGRKKSLIVFFALGDYEPCYIIIIEIIILLYGFGKGATSNEIKGSNAKILITRTRLNHQGLVLSGRLY